MISIIVIQIVHPILSERATSQWGMLTGFIGEQHEMHSFRAILFYVKQLFSLLSFESKCELYTRFATTLKYNSVECGRKTNKHQDSRLSRSSILHGPKDSYLKNGNNRLVDVLTEKYIPQQVVRCIVRCKCKLYLELNRILKRLLHRLLTCYADFEYVTSRCMQVLYTSLYMLFLQAIHQAPLNCYVSEKKANGTCHHE